LDNYREEIVVKKNRTFNNILYALLMVIMVISLFFVALAFSMVGVSGNFVYPLIILAINGGIAVLIWIKKDTLRTEYEYTFTNGDLDFAKVLGNSRRKNLGTMQVKNVEACGYVNTQSFQRYITMPGLKKINWFLNRGSDLFYFFYQKEGQKTMIVIEPSEELVEMIKLYLPRGVYQSK